jgi:hypothetical protein
MVSGKSASDKLNDHLKRDKPAEATDKVEASNGKAEPEDDAEWFAKESAAIDAELQTAE